LLKVGIFAGAALVVATSGYMIWKQSREDHASVLEQPRMPPPAPRRPTATPAPGGAYWLSPGLLASRRADAQLRIDRSLTDSAVRMGLEDLASVSRLASPDSLKAGVDILRRWRSLAESYRTTSFVMLRAYQDSANAQVKLDQWSLLDANDWKSRSAFVEGPLDGLQADSLVTSLQRLYEVLLGQQGNYSFESGRAQFAALRARVEYQRVVGLLERYGPTPANARERVSLPLSLVRHALEGPKLPPLPPESDHP
jgi:hypothetical protein